MVFQDPMSSLNPVFTVGEQLAEVLRTHVGCRRARRATARWNCWTRWASPSRASRLDAYPHELSGGQQQRVMIAMAIACEPKLLIADEPTTALDVTIQRQIVELLARLQERQKMSVLFISHDLGLVGEIADHVVVMRQRRGARGRPGVRDLHQPEGRVHQGAARLPAAAWTRGPAG